MIQGTKWLSTQALILTIAITTAGFCQAAPPVDLPVIWGRGVAYTAFNVGARGGYYKSQGLNVQQINLTTGPEAVAGIIGGSAQFGAIGSLPLILVGNQGAPVVAITRYVAGGDRAALIARKGSGIQSPKDLVGKKVAASTATIAHAMLIHMLEKEGVSADRVERVNMPPEQALPALVAGQIDASVVWEPYAAEAVDRGIATVVTRGRQYFGDASAFVIVKKDYAQRNRELVKRFLRAHFQAMKALRTDPKLATDTNMAVSKSAIRASIEASVKPLVYDPRILPSVVNDLKKDAAFLLAIKQLSKAVDVTAFIDNSYADEVAKEFPDLVSDLK